MNVYLVTADTLWGRTRKRTLGAYGINLQVFPPDAEMFLSLCRINPPDVLLLDSDGNESAVRSWIERVVEIAPLVDIVVLGEGTVRGGVEALRSGACDYVPKWVRTEALLFRIQEAGKRKADNEQRVGSLRREGGTGTGARRSGESVGEKGDRETNHGHDPSIR